MDFVKENVISTINIETSEIGLYGYFSNDLESLQRAVENERANLKTIYARLSYCLESEYERRLGCKYGNFALFYPMDKELNEMRY